MIVVDLHRRVLLRSEEQTNYLGDAVVLIYMKFMLYMFAFNTHFKLFNHAHAHTPINALHTVDMTGISWVRSLDNPKKGILENIAVKMHSRCILEC